MLTSKPAWMIFSALSATLAGFLTRSLVQRAWTAATGDDVPPADDDRSVAVAQAAAWAAGAGAAAGVARVLSRRAAAKVWEKATGEDPPEKTGKV